MAKQLHGISAKYMRRYYLSVTVPRMIYTANLLFIPESDSCKGMKQPMLKLGKVQRQASLHITGAMRSTPIDVIDTCADLLPF